MSLYDVSVVLATYNRCELLAEALQSIFQQDDAPSYEVILVDNNSTDSTAEVAKSFTSHATRNFTYLLEPRQGVSYARNTGISKARAPIIAFLDDDVCVSANWLRTLKTSFEQHPEADCIGGRILPRWEWEPPSWLTREHWAPVALQDYGQEPFIVNQSNQVCLLSANLAFRREVFDRIGMFAPELQRVKDSIGSMEDVELLTRFWRAGAEALYDPSLSVDAQVPIGRMSKDYHRRWHTGHGRFYAMLRSQEMERSHAGQLLGVPAHVYRQAIGSAVEWCKHSLTGNRSRAFTDETRLCFLAGFFRQRTRDFLRERERGPIEEIDAFSRPLARKSRRA